VSCDIPISAKLKYVAQGDAIDYIKMGCKRCDGETVGQFLGMLYKDASNNERMCGVSDLKYDVVVACLKVVRA